MENRSINAEILETASVLSQVFRIDAGHLASAIKASLRHIIFEASLEDRKDVLQELAAHLLAHPPPSGAYATVMCRNRVLDWNRSFMRARHFSLQEKVATACDGEVDGDFEDTYLALLMGTLEFAAEVEAQVDAARQVRAIWDQVPPHLRAIVGKRVVGMRLTKAEQSVLRRYRLRLAGKSSRGRPLVTEPPSGRRRKLQTSLLHYPPLHPSR
ncbi:MAG: hypothetical protein Q7K03_09920 [Dehalococcoidia bacterium]|nr:hypothetical protein [Dehalococcoidia bacterium]